MSIFSWRKPNSSITAAARPVRPSDSDAVKNANAAMRRWQLDAWRHYDTLAEIHYPACYIGNALTRFRLHIAEVPADRPTTEPQELTGDGRSDLYRAAEDILLSLGGDLGGPSEILRLYGINMTVAAACWLAGEDRASETNWELLSVSELRPQESGEFQRFPTGGTNPALGYRPNFTYRLWRTHPQFSDLADGPLQSLAADCDRLSALNASLTSRILSKMAQAGFFFVPSGMTIAAPPEAPTGDGASQTDPLVQKILQEAQRSVLEGTGAYIPSIIRGPAAEGEALRFINMDRAIDRVEMELRAELRSNIAKGMNLPPEVQEGLGAATHWTTWAISDSSYSDHIVPEAHDFVSSMTRAFLWPLLRDWNEENGGNFTEGDIRRLVIDADGSAVVSRPNGAEDARQLSDRIIISDAAMRKRSGVSPEEAPSEEEYVRQLGRKINHPYLATLGMDIQADIDWEQVAKVPRGEGAPGAGGTPPTRRPVDNGNPDPTGEKEKASDLARQWAAVASGFLLAADKTVGAKVRARCEPHPEILAVVKREPNERVIQAVEDLSAIGLSPDDIAAFYADALSPALRVLDDQRAHEFIRSVARHAGTPLTLAHLEALADRVLSARDI